MVELDEHIPEYRINIKPSNVLNEETQEIMEGYIIEVLKIIDISQDGQLTHMYKTVFEQVVTPFIYTISEQKANNIHLYEILQKVQAQIAYQLTQLKTDSSQTPESNENKKLSEQNIETELSRGWSLFIPEFGELLISHDGNIVLDTQLKKSIQINAPKQVILYNTNLTHIEIEASSVLLIGKTKSTIKSLVFKGNIKSPELINTLFIEQEAELTIEKIMLDNVFLFNFGKLNINNIDLNNGYLFNIGTIKTSDNTIFKDILYFYNKGIIEISKKLIIGTSTISNEGIIKGSILKLITSELFNNQGTLELENNLDIVGYDIINHGKINGKTGEINIISDDYVQNEGEIIASNVKFHSKEINLINGIVAGQVFYGKGNKITNKANINFQKGIINGIFLNISQLTTFEHELELIGPQTMIQNSSNGIIKTSEIISNAIIGCIENGTFNSKTINIKKHLQINSKLPQLTKIKIFSEAKLLINQTSEVPELTQIENEGITCILSKIPKLFIIKNSITGHLQIKTNSILTKINDLFGLKGKIDISASLPNLTKLNLYSGAIFSVCANADFSNLKELNVYYGAKFLADENTKFNGLKILKNSGITTFKTPLMNLEVINNEINADLHLLDRVHIRTDLINNGKILFRHKDDYKNYNERDLFIGKHYIGGEKSILKFENKCNISCDFINNGIIYSLQKMDFLYIPPKLGKFVCEEISFEISETSLNFDNFKPILSGGKNLEIIAKNGVKLINSINWNVNLYIEAPSLEINSDLTVISLTIKTQKFNNTKTISAKHFINIETNEFTNTSGRLQTYGDINIEAKGRFINTGGGRIEHNKPEIIYYSTWTNSRLNRQSQTIYRDVYYPNLSLAGVITCGTFMNIISGSFNNSFGIINSSDDLNIKSSGEVRNECGLIYSRGSTTINGTILKNGYRKGRQLISGVNPNAPIEHITTESLSILGLVRYNRKGVCFGDVCYNGRRMTIDDFMNNYPTKLQEFMGLSRSGHNRIYVPCSRASFCPPAGIYKAGEAKHGGLYLGGEHKKTYKTITGYQSQVQYSTESKYPGYIFSYGDLKICMKSDTYLGTIVSNENIYIQGVLQKSINHADRGLLIAKGNVNIELRKAALEQLAIQSENIYIKLIEEMIIKGIIEPVLMPSGQVIQLINLRKLGNQIGFLIDEKTFSEQGMRFTSPTGLVPISSKQYNEGFSIYKTSESGFISYKPETKYFIPTLQSGILSHLTTLILTPLEGRNILLTIDLTGKLKKQGSKISNLFRGMKNIVLPDGNPAILFDKSSNPDVEIEAEGEKMLVPLFDPYLICNTISKLKNIIKAQQLISIHNLENIHLAPGKINLESIDFTLESEKEIRIASEFTYSDSHYKTGVDPVDIEVPGTFIASGKKGVTLEGANIKAKNIQITSSNGNIIDLEMELDPTLTFGKQNWVREQKTITSSLKAKDNIQLNAPKGIIDQHGTNLEAGNGGITFEAQKHIINPAYEKSEIAHWAKRTFTCMNFNTPKGANIKTSGTIIFKSADTSLVGAEIIANTISNPNDGDFSIIPAYGSQNNFSMTYKNGGLFGLGKSSRNIYETRDLIERAQIITDHFESIGKGTCVFEGTIIKALDMSITKNLIEKAAYLHSKSNIVQHSSGFFAPKIKGDPFIEALKGVENIISFGDAIPTAMNIIGTGAQTLTHALTLANIAKNPNPIIAISQIFLNRFVTGFVYNNSTTTIQRKESQPIQSQVEVGILKINNDRTHLEGIWKVNKASIETGKITSDSPKHTIEQSSKTKGFNISLSPIAFIEACISPTIGTLPNISVFESEVSFDQTNHSNMIIEAGDLFIRCNDAIFRGSTIRANVIEMLVSGNLTIETIKDLFKSESNNTQISSSLSSINSLIQGVKVDNSILNPKLGVVPTIRIADEECLQERINKVSQLIGIEKFYLKVGELLYNKGAIISDGVISGKRIDEKVDEKTEKHQKVINPCIGELVTMIGQVNEFKEVQQKYITQRVLEGVNSENAIEEANEITKEIVDKVSTFIKRLQETEKKVSNEVKEIVENTKEVKVSDNMNETHIQTEILKCCHIKEFEQMLKNTHYEQNKVIEEYKKFSQTLKPKLKNYFTEIMNTIGDFCHHINDHIQKAYEIGYLYMYLDDPLIDEFNRNEIKESIINREISDRNNNLIESAETLLSIIEIIGITKCNFLKPTIKNMKFTQITKNVKPVNNTLLKGEGKFDTYAKLKKWNKENGIVGMEAHHMTSKKHMQKLGINPNDAYAINVPKELHRKTRTFGGRNKIASNLPNRSELAADVFDLRKILINEGKYNQQWKEILINYTRKQKELFPQIFTKIGK